MDTFHNSEICIEALNKIVEAKPCFWLKVPCINEDCQGYLKGNLSEIISLASAEQKRSGVSAKAVETKIVNCKCQACGLHISEVIRNWDNIPMLNEF